MAKLKEKEEVKEKVEKEAKGKATVYSVSDPDDADRLLEVGDLKVVLHSGVGAEDVELTAKQAKQLKDAYPYLSLEKK